MQDKTARKVNIPMRVAGILLILVLITAYSMSGLYARYVAFADGGDGARAAAWAFNVSEEETVQVAVDKIKVPGNKCEYTFSVSNSKGASVSEVAQRYTIKLEQFGVLPLSYTLKELNEDGTEKSSEKITAPSENMDVSGDFAAGTPQTVKYKLVIEWPATSEEQKVYIEDGISLVYLTVRFEQID